MSELPLTAEFDERRAADQGAAALAIAPTDGERLMKFRRNRDERAFEEVVQTHAQMVWGVCSQILRHQQDVEDAFQATFLILARKAHSIRATESAAGWLYRVAYRTALLAQARRRRRNESPLATEIPSLDDQLTEIERNEQAMRMLDELNSLPPRYQQPLILCYMEGRTRSEAAEQMGVSSQTIKGLLTRGTRLLRSRLIRRGVALSSSMAAVNAMTSNSLAAATTSLVTTTASLGAKFAVKSKLASLGLNGAPLKGVAACTLAEKGILAMTIAAASKPAVGLLGVCLAAGMLTIADAEPTGAQGEGGPPAAMVVALGGDEDQEEQSSTDESAAVEVTGNVNVDVAIDATVVDEEEEVVAPAAVTFSADAAPAAPPAADVVAGMAVGMLGSTGGGSQITAPAPPAPPVMQALPPAAINLEVARTFDFVATPPDVLVPRITTSGMAPAKGESAATLKLEGEYWDLKAAGLKKKADAIQLKVDGANAQLQVGEGQLNEGEILDMSAERDLTLAEVKLCEMNAQRVRDAIEERAKAEDVKSKSADLEKKVQLQIEKAMDEVKIAEKIAGETAKRATITARAAVKHAEAAGKAAAISATIPGVVTLKAPVAPVPPKPVAGFVVESDVAVVPKVELKRLHDLAGATDELRMAHDRLLRLESMKKANAQLSVEIGQLEAEIARQQKVEH